MKIIIGLGNPGTKFEHTRHNAGFLAIDNLIKDLGLKIADLRFNKKFNSEILEINNTPSLPLFIKEGEGGSSILLARPQTFMNNSGQSVRTVCNFYKIDVNKDLVIIHDDKDLPLGTIRAANASSAAGHNGVQDIIDKLGTQDFHRVRIGVESRGAPEQIPTEVFILQNFTDEELKKLTADVLPKVNEEIKKFLNS